MVSAVFSVLPVVKKRPFGIGRFRQSTFLEGGSKAAGVSDELNLQWFGGAGLGVRMCATGWCVRGVSLLTVVYVCGVWFAYQSPRSLATDNATS